jgi:hypothetical protein
MVDVDSAMSGSGVLEPDAPTAFESVQTCGSGVLSPWMSKMLQKLPSPQVPSGSSPRGKGRGKPAPPPPTTLKELYDPAFEVLPNRKWREQLLDRPLHRQMNPNDVAEIVMALEEGPLSEMLAFCDGRANATRVYMAREGSGVWGQAPSSSHRAHEQLKLLKDLAHRIERMVIEPLKALAMRLTRTELSDAAQQETVKRMLSKVEEHLKYVVWLYEKALLTPSFAGTVLDCIVTERVSATRLEGVREDVFDTAQWCLAFEDGVFDIRAGRLLRDSEARKKMQRMTVGYEYEVMMEASEGGGQAWREYDGFMARIFSSAPEVRKYLIELFAASAANVNLQVVVFHHNLQGSNGKSSLFSLLRATFGELMVKCSASAMVAGSSGAGGGSGPNVELASVEGKRLVQFTEPNALHRLNVSFLKDLTGGDEQSARRNYEHKKTFVFNGMAHV